MVAELDTSSSARPRFVTGGHRGRSASAGDIVLRSARLAEQTPRAGGSGLRYKTGIFQWDFLLRCGFWTLFGIQQCSGIDFHLRHVSGRWFTDRTTAWDATDRGYDSADDAGTQRQRERLDELGNMVQGTGVALHGTQQTTETVIQQVVTQVQSWFPTRAAATSGSDESGVASCPGAPRSSSTTSGFGCGSITADRADSATTTRTDATTGEHGSGTTVGSSDAIIAVPGASDEFSRGATPLLRRLVHRRQMHRDRVLHRLFFSLDNKVEAVGWASVALVGRLSILQWHMQSSRVEWMDGHWVNPTTYDPVTSKVSLEWIVTAQPRSPLDLALLKVKFPMLDPTLLAYAESNVYAMLSSYTSGEARSLVRQARRPNGMEAFRLLQIRFNPVTIGRQRAHLMKIANPQENIALDKLAAEVVAWENRIVDYEARPGSEKVSEQMKMAALIHMAPNKLREHLQLNAGRFVNYVDLREEVFSYLDQVAPVSQTTMDVGSLSTTKGCYNCGGPHLARDCKSKGKGKSKNGKGKGGKDGFGKGKMKGKSFGKDGKGKKGQKGVW